MAILTDPPERHLSVIPLAEAYAGELSVPVLNLHHPRTRLYPHLKRGLDICLALLGLLVLSPILLLISIGIALDTPGPILFRQERIGQHGRPFGMYKFRTMRAERRVSNFGPPKGTPDRRQRHKSAADPRITRVGRALRRTCLDELPQLLNVLHGEMSLVGPRPELPSIVESYAPWQHVRHLVAPGITGWWQINRMPDRLMHEATELDIYYVQHCSVLLDLRILARTLGAVIDGTGAY
ncbi:MAG: sugar transferase [Chloroflexi bacterium]|nr:sugar transferase [Chloroflexota bacterium]